MSTPDPTPSAQLSTFMSRFSPGSVALAEQCLQKLSQTFPGTNQLVYDYNHSVVVGYSLTENGIEAIVALAIYPEEVRLYFGAGKVLPDPKGILQGTATKVRYVPVKAESDLDHEDVQALFQAAIKHSGNEFPSGASGRMIIKTDSAKKAKKKTKAKAKAKPTAKVKAKGPKKVPKKVPRKVSKKPAKKVKKAKKSK